MEIIRCDIHDIGKTKPGVTTKQKHIERPPECSLQFRGSFLQQPQLLRSKMPTLAFHIFNLILAKRVSLQIKQILIYSQIDISFQMLHMLGYRIPVVAMFEKKMLEVTKEIKCKIIKSHLRLKLA